MNEKNTPDNVIEFHSKAATTGKSAISPKDLDYLRNVFANSHINFLLGAGFCGGVLPTLGNREQWLAHASMIGDNEAEAALQYEFFRNVLLPMARTSPTADMSKFARQLKRLLGERGTTSIPRRACLFTTNYDPLIEEALEEAAVSYNDGFEGRSHPVFATRSFGRIHYAQSLALEYSAQIPTVNVVKLHGSVTWRRASNSQDIGFRDCKDALWELSVSHPDLLSSTDLVSISDLISQSATDEDFEKLLEILNKQQVEWPASAAEFLNAYRGSFHIINPTKNKFAETVMGLTYYELLRLFANELDRNNALLVSFGFSFADEHILEIVRRALENPRLILIVCCHMAKDKEWYEEKFGDYDNVRYIVPDDKFELSELCALMNEVR